MFEVKVKKKLHSSQGEMLLDIHLNVERGKFISVYGKSGAGKTTFLKMLSGLVEPEEGFIKAGDQIWFDKSKRINISAQNRKTGFVFQDYALFPHMTVKENLEFVNPDKPNKSRINEVLDMTGLSELASRFPSTLSGGQQQRTALARALVRKPDLLLLDEPLSSLDHEMRIRLQDEIAKIHRYFGLTTVLISHDPSEIYRLSDSVIEIDLGKIVKNGSPSEVFQQPGISGKIQLIGEVLEVVQHDIVFVVKVILGNKIIKVVITKDQASGIHAGDKVLITSKAFNPVLIKIK